MKNADQNQQRLHFNACAMKEFLIFVWIFHASKSLDNGLGRTPQMGWNSWNHFRCEIDSQLVMETADAFVCKTYSLPVT